MLRNDNIEVLFITHYSGLYGANRSLLDILVGLRKYPVEPIVLCPQFGGFVDQLDSLKIKYEIVKFNTAFEYRWKSSNRLYQMYHDIKHLVSAVKKRVQNKYSVKKVFKALSSYKINLIFSNSAVLTIGEELSKNLKVPHIHQIRELPQLLNLFPDFGQRNYLRKINLSDSIIFNSHYTKQNFSKSISKKSLVIYNEIHVTQAKSKLDIDGRYFNIGIFGYLSRQKNQIEAIDAVSKLSEKEKYKLYLIGDGDINAYKSYGKKIGVENQLVFTGFISDVASYYRELDLIIVCATSEALGRITIEGMLAQKPVIGKNSGATPELIENGKNGLLYNTAAELATKIEYLYINSEVRSRIAKMGKLYAVTNFSSGKSIDALYNEIQRLAFI